MVLAKWKENIIAEFNARVSPDLHKVTINELSAVEMKRIERIFFNSNAVQYGGKEKRKDKYKFNEGALQIDSEDKVSRAFLKWLKGLGPRLSRADSPADIVAAGGHQEDGPAGEDDGLDEDKERDAQREAEEDARRRRAEEKRLRTVTERAEAQIAELAEATEAKLAELLEGANANTALVAQLLAKIDKNAAAPPKVVYVKAEEDDDAQEMRLRQERIESDLQTILRRIQQPVQPPAVVAQPPLPRVHQAPAHVYQPVQQPIVRHAPRPERSIFRWAQDSIEDLVVRALQPVKTATFKPANRQGHKRD